MSPTSLLSQLTSAPFERPCDVDWEAMRGDDKVRRCDPCARDVYALSSMSAEEAELRLLNAGEAVPCIRYARDAGGRVIHLAALRLASAPTAPYGASTRAFAMASALGVALSPASALAKARRSPPAATAPSQCVEFTQAMSAPIASATPPAAGLGAARAPSSTPRAAPAPPAAPGPTPPRPEVPMMLGGAPPPPRERAPFGTLSVKSKQPRALRIAGISLSAPLASYFLTPGDFVVEVREPAGPIRKLRVHITRDITTTLDLDKP